MKIRTLFRLPPVAVAVTAAISCAVLPAASQAEISGNVAVMSKYMFRGGAESQSPVLQGGFDYSHASGAYVGYWGSNLGYGDNGALGVENDLYVGYAGEVAGLGYDASAIYYKYIDNAEGDSMELALSASYGPVGVGVNYAVMDSSWTTVGDMYFNASVETPKYMGFGLSATAGYYMYADSAAAISSGFRNLDVSISHAIGKTGADMSLTGVLGGKDSSDSDLGNTVVLGVSYGFDL